MTRERQDTASEKTGKFPIEEQCLEATPRERGVGHGTSSMPLAGGSRSGFGSAPCFISGTQVMSTQGTNHALQHDDGLPSLPMSQSTWQAIAKTLALSPQQTLIVELILRGMQDKDIAVELGLKVSTVRTYNRRIFFRLNVENRLALVLRIFAMAQKLTSSNSCHCH